MPSIEGSISDGIISRQLRTVLHWSSNGDIVLEGATQPVTKFTEINVSSRIANATRYLEFPDGSIFETQENDAIDQLVEQLSGSKRYNLIFALENSRQFIIITLLLIILFGWSFIQFGIPAFSRNIAMIIPDEQVQYLGNDILATMDKHMFKPSALDSNVQSRLLGRFDDIISDFGISHIKVVFRHSKTIGANAFALPDGTIVIMDDLVRLSETDNEIISVLLHEIGHVQNRHSLRLAIQSFSIAVFVAIITGDVSTSSTIITGLPAVLIESGYSREMETEADEYSLSYMLKKNIPPDSFVKIMSKIEYSHNAVYRQCLQNDGEIQACIQGYDKEASDSELASDSLFDYLSSHPGTAERIQRFQGYK